MVLAAIRASALSVMCVLAMLGNCLGKPGSGDPDAGNVPADACNDKNEALSSGSCALAVGGTATQGYISFEGDQDWYRIDLPAGLTGRSMLHLTGGYAAAQTAVALSLNVLRADGTTSLVSKTDPLNGAPKPVDILLPLSASDSSTQLLVLVTDSPKDHPQRFDVLHPYSLTASIETDKDPNEPNDTTPTPVTLTASGAQSTGSAIGYLSTTGDVDQFSITVPPSSSPRQILYVHLTAPAKLTLPYRLSYTLLSPSGAPVSEGVVQNAVIAADLATARLTDPAGGTYTLVVKGYQDANSTGSVAGDPTQQYTLAVQVLPEVDSHEPDDSIGAPVVQSIASPGSPAVSFTGRLEYVPDEDWYAVDLPANASPTRLHYWFVPSSTGGRFPPLPVTPQRQVRLFTQVTGSTLTQTQLVDACMNDATVCPKAGDVTATMLEGVKAFCNAAPPQCLWSERNETPVMSDLHNFEGVIPVAPHSATVRYFLVVRDGAQVWADDRDYQVKVKWEADSDEASRWSSGAEITVPAGTLADDTGGSSFPVPSAATTLQGTIATGYGRLNSFIPAEGGPGVRGPDDYDAVPTDVDHYQISLPSVPDPMDRTWELQWTVGKSDGGVQHELALEVTFCDGDNRDAGVCTPVSQTRVTGNDLVLTYMNDSVYGWHQTAGGPLPVYDRNDTPTADTTTANAYGCFCFEPRFMRGGTFKIDVTGVDRTGYDEVPYTIKTAFTAYPKTYLNSAGATETCPAPVAVDAGAGATDGGFTGGCDFTKQ